MKLIKMKKIFFEEGIEEEVRISFPEENNKFYKGENNINDEFFEEKQPFRKLKLTYHIL